MLWHNWRASQGSGQLPVWAAALLLIGTALWAMRVDERDAERGGAGGRPSLPPGTRARTLAGPVGTARPRVGRARSLRALWRLRWTDWKATLLRVYERMTQHRLLAVAAGVVFYGLLALFPAVTAFVSFYGLFADTSTINAHLALAAGVVPEGAFQIIQDQVARIAAKGGARLSLGFVFGLLLAIWSANAGMKAVMDALNAVNGETEKRGIIRLNLISLALTLGAIMALLLAVAAVVAFPLLLSRVGLESAAGAWLSVLRWPALFLLMLFGLAVLYRFGPSRAEPRWRWLSVGEVVAAFAWLAGSALFSAYLSEFANYDATYGSLGAAIGLMMWMWLSTIVILVGAVLDAELEGGPARRMPGETAPALAAAA